MVTGAGRYRVLVVGQRDERVRSTAASVDDGLDCPVDSETDHDLAVDRIASPEVLCLVYTNEPTGREDESFTHRLVQSYPTLPIVTTTTFPEDSDPDRLEDVTVVDGTESNLVAAVQTALSDRIARRDLSAVPPPVEERWPNVDETELDRLLGGDLDRDRLGELLHKSQLLEELLEKLPMHMFVKDRSARHLYISQRYFGDQTDEFTDRIDPEVPLITHEHRWRAYEDDRYVIETGEEILKKEEFLGDVDMWNLTSKIPWHGPNGDIVGLFGTAIPITERKRRQQEVRKQNERLDEFASLVSHDLRNPLNVASARLELARSECDSDHLDHIADAHERMETLIENLLELARQGNEVGELEAVELAAFVEQCWQTVETADGRLVTGTDLTIRADSDRLQHVFENLFRNAVEHGRADVTVTVGTLDADGFYVADDGPGIPETHREGIFESGYSNAEGGTGFGLAIVREIVQAHGWEIDVTDSDDGGARFEITGVETVG